MIKISFTFARSAPLQYLSHLDMMRLFHRALRRSGLPLAYSQGFNPHLRFNLAVPLPLGVTASQEFGEVYLSLPLSAEHFLAVLRPQLPPGLQLKSAAIEDTDAQSRASIINAALYLATWASMNQFEPVPLAMQEALDRIMDKTEILAPRVSKKAKTTYVNVRPFIIEVKLEHPAGEPLIVSLLLHAGGQGGVSPSFVLDKLGLELAGLHAPFWNLHREGLYIYRDGLVQSVPEGM
ncbi:MAG TPA: TIGR03936 family radical SAM-associated protein [Candidatus Limnocylindrales bacterium]|nr:TIGR03936 family radical SAM-associated protein [Candidatus Limnocylindrales bacterium]